MPAPTRLSSQERRAAILETAIELFAERGFRGVTTRELSTALGVSEPIIYQHFPSKKDLYNAIIESTMDAGYFEALEGLRRIASTQDDAEFFQHLAQAMVRWYETRPQQLRLKIFSALEGHELMDQFNERTARPFLEVVVGYIERRISEGAFQNLDPMAAAIAFCGMVGHYCMSNILFRSQFFATDRETMIDNMVKIYLNGISK
jgi:AcrR family transcriptional regulator